MKLKKVYSRYFPLKGFLALTVFPFVFIRADQRASFNATAERHENTHALQQLELTCLGALVSVLMAVLGCGWWSVIPLLLFFELYALEWLVKLPFCGFNAFRAYLSISMEQEAYEHQPEVFYNDVRRAFAWVKFVFVIIEY